MHGRAHARISWVYWFKRVLYYQAALVYMLTRLIVNVSQVSPHAFLLCSAGDLEIGRKRSFLFLA